jgi:hypothetical protein
MKRTPLRKKGKSNISKLQKKADSMLTPIIKKIYPHCEGCGQETTVGHHWIEKSRSLNLRYNIEDNIIPLCQSCHAKIHNRFGNSVVGGLDVALIVIGKRGQEWKERMDREGRIIVKADEFWYENKIQELEKML